MERNELIEVLQNIEDETIYKLRTITKDLIDEDISIYYNKEYLVSESDYLGHIQYKIDSILDIMPTFLIDYQVLTRIYKLIDKRLGTIEYYNNVQEAKKLIQYSRCCENLDPNNSDDCY